VNRLRLSTVKRSRRRTPYVIAVFGPRATINGLAVAFGLVLLAYLSTGWAPVLALLAAGTILAVDQTLRAHPSAEFRGVGATAIYLFVPVLFTIGAGLFLHGVSHGLWNVLAAAVAAAIFGLAVQAEYLSVDAAPETYPLARFALILVSHLTAFALFTVVSTSGLPLAAATLAVAAVSLLLAVDILRELEVRTGTLFAYGAGVAAVVAEVRWAIYFLALRDLLAGGLLLVTFYVITGLIESYLSGHFDRRAVSEYGVVGVIGLLFIAGAQFLSQRA
jgi:hypothetical protein